MAKKEIPYYRIIALANLDLEEHMKQNPKMLDAPGRIKWDVDETDYHYVAKGVIRIPVQMYFSKPEGDEDPEIRRVIVAGKREYDARLEELDDAEQFEALDKQENKYGLDDTKVRAELVSSYTKNIRG